MAKSLLAENNLTAAQRYSKNGKIVLKGANLFCVQGRKQKFSVFRFPFSVFICIFAAGNF